MNTAAGNIIELASKDRVDEAWEARIARILMQIEDPTVRKLVVMAKRGRGELTDEQAERLIRRCGLVNA